MALQSDHEFAPTEIARAVFPTAFRGYDQDAVRRYLSRLAAALEHQQTFEDLGDLGTGAPAQDRVEELEAEIVALQGEVRELETELVQRSVDAADEGSRRTSEVAEFDEARAIELLGQETARVLESARSAAADILKRAESQASSLKADAKKELAEARRKTKQMVADKRAEAEAAIDELTAEAERTANQITGDAEEHRSTVVEESAKILAEAEARAEAAQKTAERRARQTVADAEALRQQVVAELVSDRRTATADLDRMLQARDRLALSLAVARTELDEVADQLADVEAGVGSDSGDQRSAEVDDDEVARLIERLDAGRTESGAEPAAEVEPESGADGPGAEDRGQSSGRRSTVDEPTVEMPAITPEAVPPHLDRAPDDDLDPDLDLDPALDLDAADPDAGLDLDVDLEIEPDQDAADADETPAPTSNGVFDRDDDHLVGGGADGDTDLDTDPDIDLDVDLDIDLDKVASADGEDLNSRPADGVPLSLVEGFSTIVLNDEDVASARSGRSTDRSTEAAPVATVDEVAVDGSVDPSRIVTTVAARSNGRSANRTRGDLVIDEPFTDRLPDWFGARDVAVTRSEANLRRQLRRALNDDQSEVLDRLRSGRGRIEADELRDESEQREHFLAPLRRGLTDIARAGARAGGAEDVDAASLDNVIDQMAAYVVDRVRRPTVGAIEEADHTDREKILEPIRSVYRDFRNIGLPELVADALNEAFAIGFYDSIADGTPVLWAIDPRTDPDPVCEVNRDRTDLIKGEPFPSGHVRPLALPGCRCLVIGID